MPEKPHSRVASLGLAMLAAGLLAACGAGPEPGSPATAADVEAALARPEPLARAEALGRTYQHLSAEALPAVLALYEDGFYDLGATELVLLAEWWTGFDAPAAVDWARGDWRTDQPEVLASVIRAWARQDPKAALRWFEAGKNASPPLRNALLSGWEESGVDGHFEYVRAMGPGEMRQRALATLARRKVLREGAAAAFDWVEAMPNDDDKFKLNLTRRVGSAAAMHEPLVAAERAAPLASEPFGDGLLRRVGKRWALRDGAAAMRWLRTLPAGPSRTEAVHETYLAWVNRDRVAALGFMEDAPDPAFDPARALYAQLIGEQDAQAGFAIAERIEEEERRWATVGRIWRRWELRDAGAAKDWLEQASHIPEFYRERMAQNPARRGQQVRQQGQADAPGS